MNHLYLAAAAQHATKWQPSHAEVSDIRGVGIGLLVFMLVIGVRFLVRETRRSSVETPAHARMVNAEQEYAGYETE